MLESESFWELRQRLWQEPIPRKPQIIEPKPSVPIDTEIKRFIPKDIRLIGKARYKSLIALGFPEYLAPYVGRTYAPYWEMRCFWLPFAKTFADSECESQGYRFDIRSGDKHAVSNTLEQLDKICREFNAPDIYYGLTIWIHSPFKTMLKDPDKTYHALNAISKLTWQINEELKKINAQINVTFLNKPHANLDYWSHSFVSILAFAWHRFTGENPKPTERFTDFVFQSAYTLDPDHEWKFDAAIAHVLKAHRGTDWSLSKNKRIFFHQSRGLWNNINFKANFSDEKKKYIQSKMRKTFDGF